jgi:hypothetical protein
MEEQSDSQSELQRDASPFTRKGLCRRGVLHWTAVTNRVPDKDTEFQNGVTLALLGPRPNLPRNRTIELHKDDEPNAPVRAENTQQRMLQITSRVYDHRRRHAKVQDKQRHRHGENAVAQRCEALHALPGDLVVGGGQVCSV